MMCHEQNPATEPRLPHLSNPLDFAGETSGAAAQTAGFHHGNPWLVLFVATHHFDRPSWGQLILWTGVGNCPILGILDITWKSSHYRPYIPVGWCSMGTFNDPCWSKLWQIPVAWQMTLEGAEDLWAESVAEVNRTKSTWQTSPMLVCPVNSSYSTVLLWYFFYMWCGKANNGVYDGNDGYNGNIAHTIIVGYDHHIPSYIYGNNG